jgi:ABC-type branched-subunit amino acid transport system substrate-binding protein
MLRASFFHYLLAFALIFVLSGCENLHEGSGFGAETIDLTTPHAPALPAQDQDLTRKAPDLAGTLREPVRVAILVPQTGVHAAIGQALTQAAQLAVFDMNEPQFQLVPKDTQGTAAGTKKAIDEAAAEGVKLILGPVFSHEVEAAKPTAAVYGLNVIGFSTDWRVAGDNALTMGVLPFGQVERVMDYAARHGVKRVGVVAGTDTYGDAVLSLFERAAARYGMTIVKTVRMAADGRDSTSALAKLDLKNTSYDALFVPMGAQATRLVASTLKISENKAKLLGTGLWDDASVLKDPAMAGAIYAAPAPDIRDSFERNYKRVYGDVPPRIASIGYDAAALAIVLARKASSAGQRVSYDRMAFINPNGFSGIDGIFRFTRNGLIERGMAVLEVRQGRAHVLEDAPATFVE